MGFAGKALAVLGASAVFVLSGAEAASKLRYDVVLNPETTSLSVTVRGRDLAQDPSAWALVAEPFGKKNLLGSVVTSRRGRSVVAAYQVAIEPKATSNSPDAEFDARRLRAWGEGLFLFPKGAVQDSLIEVCFQAPTGWTTLTTEGPAKPCVNVRGTEALGELAILSGSYEDLSFKAGGSQVHVAWPRDYQADQRSLRQGIQSLVAASQRYFGQRPPAKVFLGMDLLNGRPTFAVGNNETNSRASSTIYLVANDSRPQGSEWFKLPAHELVHSWIPNAFGNIQGIGPIFTEGFSDYVTLQLLVETGLASREDFRSRLEKWVVEQQYMSSTQARREANKQALEYRQGMVAALVLDVALLRATHGKAGFQELMAELVRLHGGKSDLTHAAVADLAGRMGGSDVAALYSRAIATNGAPLDLEQLLSGSGILFTAPKTPELWGKALKGEMSVLHIAPQSEQEKAALERYFRHARPAASMERS